MEVSNRVMNPPASGAPHPEIILECKGITKKFPGTVALDQVDFQVVRGEVHALVGQNGAGKSTLVKVITGVYTHDGGEIHMNGQPVRLARPQDAERVGIAIIHQDQQLVPQFDVKRNIFLGREYKKLGFLDFGRMRAETQRVLEAIHVDFGPDVLIRDLSVGQREQVAIASALLKQPKILILDEPTASLSRKEVEELFGIIRSLKEQGVTIIYISHHFDEIFEISDRITVLRDGKNVATRQIHDCNKKEVIEIMVGRELSQLYPKKEIATGETLLEVRDLQYADKLHQINLALRSGEIVGIAGILGSGIADLAKCLFGIEKISAGEVLIDGKPAALSSPAGAKDCGIALIPEDRRTEGLVSGMTIKENLSLSFTEKFGKKGFLRESVEQKLAKGVADRLKVKATGVQQTVDTLSGGNQQKVVIGRWLFGNSRIFIFNQPTTGVDVGSKVEIYNVMTELAQNGAGILVISQDFEELLGMCDRILVLAGGTITKTFAYGEATEQDILQYATDNTQ